MSQEEEEVGITQYKPLLIILTQYQHHGGGGEVEHDLETLLLLLQCPGCSISATAPIYQCAQVNNNLLINIASNPNLSYYLSLTLIKWESQNPFTEVCVCGGGDVCIGPIITFLNGPHNS